MSDINLLLIDNSKNDVELIQSYLEKDRRYSYSVDVAKNLNEAEKMMNRNEFDAVFLDFLLPSSTCLDAVRTLLVKYPQVVIIVLASGRDESAALQAVHFGAQDYLNKNNLTPDLLHRSIVYAIERKKNSLARSALFEDLGRALDELAALQSLLPVCASCKNVRYENGEWQPIDKLVSKQSARKSVRIICPTCLEKFETC